GAERLAARSDTGACRLEPLRVHVDQQDLRARARQLARAALADRPRAAGEQRHLARERRNLALAELRLLEAPVLDVEQVAFRQALVAAERAGPDLRAHSVLRDVRRDPR